MKLIIPFIGLLLASAAFSQQQQTLESLLQIALENNLSIKLERNVVAQTAVQNNPGNAGYMPTVGVTADQFWASTNTRQEFFSGQVNDKSGAKNNAFNAAVRLDWTFFDGFTMFATDKRLQLQEDAARIQLSGKAEMLIYQVSALYYSLVFQQRMTEVYRNAIDLSIERNKLAQLKYDNGALSELQLIQTQLDLQADSAQLFQQNFTILQLKNTLKEVLNLPATAEINITSTNSIIPNINSEQIMQAALEQNSSILYEKASIAIIDQQRKEAQGKYYPQLSFYSQFSFANSQSQVGILASNRSLGPGVGLTLRWNILDRLSTFTALKTNEIQQESAQLLLEQQQQKIRYEINNSLAEYEFTKRVFDFENTNIRSTEQLLDITQKALENGSLTPLEVREIQYSVVAAKNRQLNAELAMQLTALNLSLFSGNFKSLIQ